MNNVRYSPSRSPISKAVALTIAMGDLRGFALLVLAIFATSVMSIAPLSSHTLPDGLQSVNGSDHNGGCSRVAAQGRICVELDEGATSDLTDCIIQSLGGFQSSWAAGLFTVNRSGQSFHIGFEFSRPVNFTRVELDLFNCPEWGIAAQYITVYEYSFGILNFLAVLGRALGRTRANITSCTSNVRAVIPLVLPQNPTTSYVIDLTFDDAVTNPQWVHIAEVRFLEEDTQYPTPRSTASQDVTFMRQPQDTKAVVGSDAFFPCTYVGTRDVPHWVINQTVSHVVSQLPLGHSYNGTGLILHKVDVSMNATEYKCCFEIHAGQGVFEEACSSSGMLIISAGFIEHPTPVQTAPGELGRFHCTTVATSVCSIQWRINRTLTIDSEADAYSIPARTGMGMLSSMLHLLAMPQHNNSEVECCAYSDTRGEEICTNPVSLTITGVQTKPGAPTMTSLLSSTTSSITIEIQLSPEGISPILSIAVNFTSPASHPVQSIPGPFSPGELVTANLIELEAETEYNFTLFAINFNGVSPASVETSSRTDCLCESPQPVPCGLVCDIGIWTGFVLVVLLVILCIILTLCYGYVRKKGTPKESAPSQSDAPAGNNAFQAQPDSGRVLPDGGWISQGVIQSGSRTNDRGSDNQELRTHILWSDV